MTASTLPPANDAVETSRAVVPLPSAQEEPRTSSSAPKYSPQVITLTKPALASPKAAGLAASAPTPSTNGLSHDGQSAGQKPAAGLRVLAESRKGSNPTETTLAFKGPPRKAATSHPIPKHFLGLALGMGMLAAAVLAGTALARRAKAPRRSTTRPSQPSTSGKLVLEGAPLPPEPAPGE